VNAVRSAALQEKLNVGSKEVFKAGSALAAGVAKRERPVVP